MWGTDVCVNRAGVSHVMVNVNACVHVCACDWKLTSVYRVLSDCDYACF